VRRANRCSCASRRPPNVNPRNKKKEVPTLNVFGPRFIENYARANRQKASGIAAKEKILKRHLCPRFGHKRLDEIDDEDVQSLKSGLAHRSRKTVNNVLTVLSKLLKVAVKWKVIKSMPCTIDLLKVARGTPSSYEFSEYARLVEAAAKIDARTHLAVLLGGDAGLRRGEILALRWCDVDFRRRQLKHPAGRLGNHRRFAQGWPRAHRADDGGPLRRSARVPASSWRPRLLRR
jgi:integrase